jgi:hypothetical protein
VASDPGKTSNIKNKTQHQYARKRRHLYDMGGEKVAMLMKGSNDGSAHSLWPQDYRRRVGNNEAGGRNVMEKAI